MAGFFDESYYLKHKADQLAKSGVTDADGKPYTADTLKSALSDLGLSPEDHYKAYGSSEKLNPNPYFNEVEYLAAKKAQLAESDPSWATKTVEELRDALNATGMTAAEHYEKYGAFEANSKGVLLNPSNAFDANAYFAAKLVELKSAGVEGADTMTVAQVVEFFKEAGMSPVAHYETHGAGEATGTGVALVQTVPSDQRVPNDPARTENVPGNYNPPTVGATSPDAAPTPVAKPADMGAKVPASVSPSVTPPAKPLPVPGDSDYKAPPAGLEDTNEKPVVPPSDATNGNWAQVNPDGSADLVDKDGNSAGTLPPNSFDPSKPIDPSVPPTPPTPENPGGGDSTVYFSASLATVADTDTLTLRDTATGQISIDIAASSGGSGGDIEILQGTTPYVFDSVTQSDTLNINASGLKGHGVFVASEKTINAFTGSAQNDHVSINLKDVPVNDSGDVTAIFNGGAGTDTLEFYLDKTANANKLLRDPSTHSGGGNTTSGDMFIFSEKGIAAVAEGSTASQGFEILRFAAATASWTNGDVKQSNALVVLDAAKTANSFKEFHFSENARVYNLADTETVKDVSQNMTITMSLDAASGSDSVHLDTAAKNFGHKTILAKTVDYDADGYKNDDSSFSNLTISGNGNVVFDNSASSGGVTVNSSLAYSTVTNEGATYETGTLLFKGGTDVDTITLTGTGHNKIDTGKGADSITLSTAAGTDVVWLDYQDYYPHDGDGKDTSVTAGANESGGVAGFTDIDTITNFKVGANGDQLGVSSFIGKWVEGKTAPTLESHEGAMVDRTVTSVSANTTKQAVADNGIYVIKDVEFEGKAGAQADVFKYLFGETATDGAWLKDNGGDTPGASGTEAVVVVQGKEKAYVYYIDSDANGVAGFAANEVALVAVLEGVTSTSAPLTIENFA